MASLFTLRGGKKRRAPNVDFVYIIVVPIFEVHDMKGVGIGGSSFEIRDMKFSVEMNGRLSSIA